MFDDRLDILSPGKLPNMVNLENLKYTRFSRNPRIARLMADFGYVKELNEGVKRIYDEMQDYFLKEPEYSDPANKSVKLKLENNIDHQTSKFLHSPLLLNSLYELLHLLFLQAKRIPDTQVLK